MSIALLLCPITCLNMILSVWLVWLFISGRRPRHALFALLVR